MCAQSLSCLWLFMTPWTVAHQAPLSMGFSRQEILDWVVISSSREPSQCRDWTLISFLSCIAGGFFYHWVTFTYFWLPQWLSGKESTCNAGDPGSIHGLGRSPGEGNGKPLQYSCLENPMSSMKRQNDRILKEELPGSVGAQYATGDQWRNNSRKNEGMDQSKNNTQLWMWLVIDARSDAVKSNTA